MLLPMTCNAIFMGVAIYQKIVRWLRMGKDKRCDMKRHIMYLPFHSQNVGR
jgi:hypothetical protein